MLSLHWLLEVLVHVESILLYDHVINSPILAPWMLRLRPLTLHDTQAQKMKAFLPISRIKALRKLKDSARRSSKGRYVEDLVTSPTRSQPRSLLLTNFEQYTCSSRNFLSAWENSILK